MKTGDRREREGRKRDGNRGRERIAPFCWVIAAPETT